MSVCKRVDASPELDVFEGSEGSGSGETIALKELGRKADTAIQKITDIEKAVADQKDSATLDIDRVEKNFKDAVDELDEKIMDLKSRSVFRPGELVGPKQFKVPTLGTVTKGRFSGYPVSDCVMVCKILDRCVQLRRAHAGQLGNYDVRPPSRELRAIHDNAVKAYTETGAGTGDEYVRTEMSAQVWEDFFITSRVVGQFESIDMPSNPYEIPLDFAQSLFTKGTENTAPSDDDAATRKSTLTTTELVNIKRWSYSLDETSVLAIFPALRRNLARDAARYMDNFVMNADATSGATGNINLDDSTPGSDSYYLSAGDDGLRHQFLVDNTAQGKDASGALTHSILLDGLGLMDEYAVDTDNVVIFAGIQTYLKSIRGLAEVVTLDKFGPNASIRTGQVAGVEGSAIVPSASIGKTEADGKVSNTANNNTKGQIVAVHTGMWMNGFNRRVMIEMDVDITKRQFILVTSFRIATTCFGTRSSALHTSGIYNITI